jgi:hypothetical protein
MFAEQQRVVARHFTVKTTVPIVIAFHIAVAGDVVAVAVDVIVNRLDAADITARRRARVAEETGRRVLHRVEAEAVALGLVHHPHRRRG